MIGIDSEIGRLRTVVVHRPGSEVEQMTPATAQELLYNDIIPVEEVQQEHDELTAVLRLVAEVHELQDLVAESLAVESVRERMSRDLIGDSLGPISPSDLPSDPRALAVGLVEGIRNRSDRLSPVLEGPQFVIPPLPNLYFTRDAGFVIGPVPFQSEMAHAVRTNEARLASIAIAHLAEARTPTIINGKDVIAEGGDVHVLAPDVLLLGVGERTSASAVDSILEQYTRVIDRPVTAIVVVLPRERATIHLDMIFTVLDQDAALAFAPLVRGHHSVRTFQIDASPTGRWRIDERQDLVSAVEAVLNRKLWIVPCGGELEEQQFREQWFSGCNSVAIAPGKVLVYRNNRRTLSELDRAGFTVADSQRIIDRPEEYLVDKNDRIVPGRLAVALPGVELARGGGGPRCMTMPILRDSVEEV